MSLSTAPGGDERLRSKPKKRLAIIVSHPIQHFVSLYRALADSPDIVVRVFYASRIGLDPYFDAEMNVELAWKMDLLAGYDHVFLAGAERVKSIGFSTIDSPGLEDALDAYDPDSVMVYGYNQRNALRAADWGHRMGRAVLMISDSELLQRRAFWRRAVKRLLVPLAYRRIDAFLSVGDRNEAYYRHHGVPASRIFRSPFTIDEGAFKRAAAVRAEVRAALRKDLGLEPDAIIALFVGKLTERKRPQDLLRAVSALADDGVTVHAVFAGNGALMEPMRQEIEALGAPGHLLGFVNVDRLPGLYAASDLLVHPSEADPHPLVCSEAACVGLPVVLSDRIGAEGATDIARSGENALVYPVGDVQALAAHIRSLAEDADLRAAMGRRALEIFGELDLHRSVDGIRRAIEAGPRRGRRA
ncbi:glycosyltransferase family 4 protein [Sphingomonas donggukensis]|uniref:Glycosyltransferase family 4 protein n=1 Tax=Sphingomonas donggukensis TaxID=2949093 RepID=A0ABY4TPZ1_9SPHN|nr:glycosyltransferase family 4 protein [Sphingomonas donggukensis]URW74447.1 glycosyltransferase family 4 protein [Sphingomonas donggukensis]